MGKAKLISILAVVLACRLASADMVRSVRAPSFDVLASAGGRLGNALPAEAVVACPPQCIFVALCDDLADRLPRLQSLQDVSATRWVPPKLAAAVAGAAAADSRASDPEQIVELPPPPSGAALTLSGLLTLAGLQVARQARHAGLAALLNAAYVPDWYHADAVQVGHSIPFEFQPTLQPVCSVFGLVASEADRCASRSCLPDVEDRVRFDQHKLLALAPRGPPCNS